MLQLSLNTTKQYFNCFCFIIQLLVTTVTSDSGDRKNYPLSSDTSPLSNISAYFNTFLCFLIWQLKRGWLNRGYFFL